MLVQQFGGTLFTLAKDVKVQVEFNPALVREYRLLGYENRLLAAEDFNDDHKDAGELGAGQQVTALYEVVPVGAPAATSIDPLKYQTTKTAHSSSSELLTVKLRYQEPQGSASRLLALPVAGPTTPMEQASENLRFAAAVAQFGMLLRESKHRGTATWQNTAKLAEEAQGNDPEGNRNELVQLVKIAAGLQPFQGRYGSR